MVPRVFIFGAKRPLRATTLLSLLSSWSMVANLVNKDDSLARQTQVVFLENYRSAQLSSSFQQMSEQISLASKEASGTSNMKFMMTGAITLATLDGPISRLRTRSVMTILSSSEWTQGPSLRALCSAMIITHAVSMKAIQTFIGWSTHLCQWNDSKCFVKKALKSTRHSSPQRRILPLGRFPCLRGSSREDWYILSWQRKMGSHEPINIATSDKFTSDDTIGAICQEIWNLEK